MVKFYSFKTLYDHPWQSVTQAVWQKYPNPFASHVLSSDVVDRTVDTEAGTITTTRLLLKAGNIPAWGRHFLKVSETFILETSVVNLREKVMTTVTRNLSHAKLMLVEETQTYTVNEEDSARTKVQTDVAIISNTGWSPIQSKVEKFGLTQFKDNAMRSSKGLMHVLEALKNRSLNPSNNNRPAHT